MGIIQFITNRYKRTQIMKNNKISKKRFSLRKAEKCLDKSCDQMDMLLKKISTLENRKARAKQIKNPALSEVVDFELRTMRGVYAMFYDFAEELSEQMAYVYNQQRQMTPLTEELLAAEMM